MQHGRPEQLGSARQPGSAQSPGSTDQRSDHGRPTRVAVAVRDGEPAWTLLDSGDAIAPRPVWGRGDTLRCGLVGVRMMLLAGDHIEVHVEVGPGAALELVEPAAVVAHDADGVPSSLSMVANVAEGGVLVYEGAPLIAATGSDVTRSFRVTLREDARILLRDTLVLGRVGETGGRIRSHTEVRDADGDLLVEELELGGDVASLPGLFGTARILDSTVAVGWEPPEVEGLPADSVLRLDEPGAIVRAIVEPGEPPVDTSGITFAAWRHALSVTVSSSSLC